MANTKHLPFALSLSKCPFILNLSKDKLSANGFLSKFNARKHQTCAATPNQRSSKLGSASSTSLGP